MVTFVNTFRTAHGTKCKTYKEYVYNIKYTNGAFVENVEQDCEHLSAQSWLFSHSNEKSPLWDQVPTEAIWH